MINTPIQSVHRTHHSSQPICDHPVVRHGPHRTHPQCPLSPVRAIATVVKTPLTGANKIQEDTGHLPGNAGMQSSCLVF